MRFSQNIDAKKNFFNRFAKKRAKGQALLDLVFQHLELVEKDYFGLQFPEPIAASDGVVSTFYHSAKTD